MSSQLEGKVCVITGTSGSMGRAPTLACAHQAMFVVTYDLSDVGGVP